MIPSTPTGPSTSGVPQLDSITASYYLPAGPEDFRAHRLRHAQQETMSYGPLRGRRYALGPYANPTSSPSPTTSTTEEHAAFCEAFDLSSLDQNELPVGWTVDEETGYMSFQGELQDYWEIKSGCLLRHHLKPRRKMFSLDQARDCPIPSDRIDRLRVVLTRYSSGRSGIHMDGYAHQNHINNRPEEEQWTGTTAFQINAATRREMGMVICRQVR